MPKASDILGMNARNQLYTSRNPKSARRLAGSKYATKIMLQDSKIPTAQLYAILGTTEDVQEFEWSKLSGNFAIKPTNSNGGKGIVVFRTQEPDLQSWKDTVGRRWTLEDIKLHCFDILEGQYSIYGANSNVIVEERVPIHSKLLKYAYRGTPDIRVIVFNKVPVMAMMRLPTPQSEGRANLHQGAIGVGIDMFSGVTTHAVTGDGNPITILPSSKRKLNGILIPYWKEILTTAVRTAEAAGLQYCGVDLFLHEEKGPMVVELNANPGLSIQIANNAGLRRRLDRVEDINVLNPAHGVRIGQALFAENFSDKIKAEDGLIILNPFEEIELLGRQKLNKTQKALINTGRFRSAISSDLARELELIEFDDVLWFQQEKEEGRVPVVELDMKIKGRKIHSALIVSRKLNKSKNQIEIGRNDLKGFLVGETQ